MSPLQAAAERSKTVILVKNLPVGTLAAELQETFGRFGSLGRVLLPEGGITAIVEFLEPLEARKAFRQLAYSKVGLLQGKWGADALIILAWCGKRRSRTTLLHHTER